MGEDLSNCSGVMPIAIRYLRYSSSTVFMMIHDSLCVHDSLFVVVVVVGCNVAFRRRGSDGHRAGR